ncbi:hypothetical protein HMPREF1986_02039 [Oribacterium sp. oral taxon 078 str. F0263]|nr:hypothetical protein HMPREF1986_02039 [Oribacterium sp. oral taxon 078 str. F0263]
MISWWHCRRPFRFFLPDPLSGALPASIAYICRGRGQRKRSALGGENHRKTLRRPANTDSGMERERGGCLGAPDGYREGYENGTAIIERY